jgi:hypothetical protein
MLTSDVLWGSRLTSVQFDPVEHRCELAAEVTARGHRRSYLVTCHSTTEIRFHNEIPEPWTYAEITEVHLSDDESSGRRLLHVVLWSEDAELAVRCASVEITETHV